MVDAGAFGSVAKCIDWQMGRIVALKISKNKKKDRDNAWLEAKRLNEIKVHQRQSTEKNQIVEILDSFTFRQHYVIVFELLNINLYKWIRTSNI